MLSQLSTQLPARLARPGRLAILLAAAFSGGAVAEAAISHIPPKECL